MKQPKLFSPFFPATTAQEWEELIMKDLKGQDFEKKLIWNTIEGIKVRPYYRLEDSDLQANKFISVRLKKDNSWLVNQEVYDPRPAQANEEAKKYIQMGAGSLTFDVSKINNSRDLAEMLRDINPEIIDLHFANANCFRFFRGVLEEYSDEMKIDKNAFYGCLLADPLCNALISGDFPDYSLAKFNKLHELTVKADKSFPNIRTICINGDIFHNSGGHALHEIAFSLAAAKEYLEYLTALNLSIDKIASKFLFRVAIGSNYFIEIAKLRALRHLWTEITGKYRPRFEESGIARIHAFSATFNKTIYDSHTNLLRLTTEGMAAMIGGADILTLIPFDSLYRDPDDFSIRLSLNIQHILKEEAYLDKVVDPASGSYYIENLTKLLVDATWGLLFEVEKRGGFIEAMRNNFIQDEIAKTKNEREKMIQTKKENVLGVSLYPESEERMYDKIKVRNLFEEPYEGVDFKALNLARKATLFEKLRLATEEYSITKGWLPQVFLFPVGHLAMSMARMNFSKNFFAAAGYKIAENSRFITIDEGLQHLKEMMPDMVVVCSSDDDYKMLVPEIVRGVRKINPDIFIIVAGYPTEIIEELHAAGVDDFIHIKTNMLEKLLSYNERFGIN